MARGSLDRQAEGVCIGRLARIEDRDGTKVATIGVTRYAVEQLGDVTQVDLPKEGESVKQAEVFGSVESVKAEVVRIDAFSGLPHGPAGFVER